MTKQVYTEINLQMQNIINYWKEHKIMKDQIQAFEYLQNDSDMRVNAMHEINVTMRDTSTPAFFISDNGETLYCKCYVEDTENIKNSHDSLLDTFATLLEQTEYGRLEDTEGEDAAEDWDAEQSEDFFDQIFEHTPDSFITSKNTTDASELLAGDTKDSDGNFQYLEESC